MSKYFIEKEKILLSKYIEEIVKEDSKYYSAIQKEKTVAEVKYLIQCFGDIEMSRDIISKFCDQFHCFGGRYDVRTDLETLKGVYEITKIYPQLSLEALDEIFFVYIKDLFDKYELVDKLGKLIKLFGETDECFEIYKIYIGKKADELQKKYEQKALILDDYKEEYGEMFIDYLKGLIKRKHFSIDEIISSMPSSELIKKDEEQLSDISKKTRIYFGACYPVSYSMMLAFIKGNIEKYPDQPSYYIDVCKQDIPTTFTKTEFLESIEKQKKKIK